MVCASKAKDAMVLIDRFGSGGENIIHRANLGADIAVDTRILYAKLLMVGNKFGAIKISELREVFVKNIAFCSINFSLFDVLQDLFKSLLCVLGGEFFLLLFHIPKF